MRALLLATAFLSAACSAQSEQAGNAAAQTSSAGDGSRPFAVSVVTDFNEPWAMTFLPGGEALVTEKRGRLLLWTGGDRKVEVAGVPRVDYGGQGGFGDVRRALRFRGNDRQSAGNAWGFGQSTFRSTGTILTQLGRGWKERFAR